MSVMTVKTLCMSIVTVFGIIGGLVVAIYDSTDGIGSVEVLIGLNVIVLGAIWQLGREVSMLRGEMKGKASRDDVRHAIAQFQKGES